MANVVGEAAELEGFQRHTAFDAATVTTPLEPQFDIKLPPCLKVTDPVAPFVSVAVSVSTVPTNAESRAVVSLTEGTVVVREMVAVAVAESKLESPALVAVITQVPEPDVAVRIELLDPESAHEAEFEEYVVEAELKAPVAARVIC